MEQLHRVLRARDLAQAPVHTFILRRTPDFGQISKVQDDAARRRMIGCPTGQVIGMTVWKSPFPGDWDRGEVGAVGSVALPQTGI